MPSQLFRGIISQIYFVYNDNGIFLCFEFMKTQRLAVLSEDYFMTEPIMTYIWTFILAVMPISEIRGSIIYGLSQVDHNFLNILFIYVLSVIANFTCSVYSISVPPPIIKWLKKTKLLGKFATWLEARTHRKRRGYIQKKAQRRRLLRYIYFVSIPFPHNGSVDRFNDCRAS